MINVFLLLGSNLGKRELYLQKAINLIELDIAPVTKRSAIYLTQSWGKTDEPDYLNQVIEIKTTSNAQEVLDKVLAIEIILGRQRQVKWGSRTIDIDILFYGDKVINQPGLVVPHPELHKRRFTLVPLAQIAPKFVHPVLKKDISQLKNELIDDLIVKKL
jgi:2-amino-4-hydroxy-6-hydroxymethyldihydropteridine diphosphokinase